MIEATTIAAGRPEVAALDWTGLVAEGRDLLAAMTDGGWTDFNAHDPGITLLETFAYALTDLAYRAGHPVADLLAGGASLAGPGELLTCRAVTPADLRRVVLDVAGVRGAWIEPSDHPTLRLRHMPGARELDFERGPVPGGDPVRLAGVHRVLVEKSSREDRSATELARAVAVALHRQRGLGEDFDAVDVLAPLPVAAAATLEIDDPGRADAVLLAVYAALDDYCSPRPAWRDAAGLRGRGWTTEAIYDGPATGGGRLDGGDTAPPRRPALQLSDVIAALSRVEGVRAVRRVWIGIGGEDLSGPPRWSLPIPADRVPRFDPRASRITLVAGGGTALDSTVRDDLAQLFAERSAAAVRPATFAETPPAAGRDRHLADYRPLRFDLPLAYGVAPGALPPDTPVARRAQAAQLRAYLAILDALLANQFAQLAAAGTLLGPAPGASYRTQPAEADASPGELTIAAGELTPALLQDLVEPGGAGVDRRNRLLAHLLARLGEEVPSVPPPAGLGIGPELPAARRVLASRADFLAGFARLSAGRGTGPDLLDPADEPVVLERIRLKLGLSPAEGARLRLVEHILLRPLAEDDDTAQVLLAGAAGPDPYSLQLSLVADAALQPAAASLARVARDEVPAHLALHVRWLDATAFDGFAAAYSRWRATLAAERREGVGLTTEPA